MTVLFVTPSDDRSSRLCAKWAAELAAEFPNRVTVLSGTSRQALDEALATHQHVFYFGHGEPEALIVPPGLLREKIVLGDRENLPGVADRIVVAVACWSCEGLATQVTNAPGSFPVVAYLGWLDDISWPDERPGPIGDAVVEGLTALFEGRTVRDCVSALRDAFDEAHDTYRTPGGMAPDRAAFGKMCALYWKARLDLRGDWEAVL